MWRGIAFTARHKQIPAPQVQPQSVATEAGVSAKTIVAHARTMAASKAGFDSGYRHTAPMPHDDTEQLRAEISELSNLLLKANDAAFALAGIIGRVLVDAGAISREEFAEAIEHKAGNPTSEDHNRLLSAFARAVRMNFPGGRFEVIEGGQGGSVDHDTI